MKQIKNAFIIFTVFMLCVLILLVLKVRTFSFNTEYVGTYSDEELKTYKEVWQNINDSFEAGKNELSVWILAIWIILLIGGYILLFVIYRTQIKPVRELEEFATEIAKGNLDVPLPIRKGNISGSFTESFDLMREELKSAKEREMASERAKREMVAELSHDLKTPVATIKATCEVLEMIYRQKAEQEQINPAETQSMIEKIGYISSKIEVINKLVENVFHANLDDMEEVQVNAVECDSKTIQTYFESLKDSGHIIIENDIPECLVYIDKLRMEQVVDNVIGNSYKYAGTDIRVSFAETGLDLPSGKKEHFIKITVKDEGPGVPEDELPLIVEKYYRGKGNSEKTGYGLGLYLVKHYMEKQGGGMEYYNDNGFTVELFVRKV